MEQHSYADNLFEKVRPLFSALGDEDRQQMLLLLAYQPRLSVGELTVQTKLSRPTVSHHIKVLREAGLVIEQKEGRKRYYKPTFLRYVTPLRELVDYAEAMEQEKCNIKGSD